MIKYFTILTISIFIFTNINSLYSQVSQEWIHRYTGPEASTDSPVDFAADSKGNTYLTGKSIVGGGYFKMITVKFNSSGIRKWIAKYSGPPNQNEDGKSVSVDTSGNVYVAGNVRGPSGLFDMLVIKYDSSGNKLWENLYNSPSNLDDLSNTSALDAEGNFYVGGYSNGTGTSADYILLKYNSSGVFQWVKRFNGVSNSDDYLIKLAVTSNGNIAVGGYSFKSLASYNFVTILYDPSGNVLWTREYNGPSSSSDQLSDLVTDAGSNVYVSGKSSGSGTGLDFAVVKYDAAGNQQWVSRFTGAGTSEENPFAMSVDLAGNVFLTGYSNTFSPYYDFLTVKFNSSGVQQWFKYYNGVENFFDKAVDVLNDAEGNSYVTGNSVKSSDGTSDLILIKYNPSGDVLWTKTYDGPGGQDDIPIKLIKNNMGNVLVLGDSYSFFFNPLCGTSDYLILNYNQDASLNWESRYDGAGTGIDIPVSLVNDNSGNSYATGYSFDKVANYDMATVKYNSSGAPLWAARYDGNSGIDKSADVAVDNSGNVFTCGTSQGASSGNDIVTIKYNPDGTENWVQRYNGSSNGDDYAAGIFVDASGNVYTGGYRDSSGTGKDFILIKYNSSGVIQWKAFYNGPGNADDIMTAMISDAAGNIFVTGSSIGAGTLEDVAVVKFGINGNLLWQARYNGFLNNSDIPSDIVLDNSGNVIVTGKTFTGTAEASLSSQNFDMLTVKYNSSGSQQWAALHNGTLNSEDESNSVTTDNAGNIYAAGSSVNTISNSDFTIIKYLPDGTQSWVKNINGAAGLDDKAFSICSDLSGQIYATGYCNDGITGYNFLTVKLNQSGILKWEEKYNYIDNDTDKAVMIRNDAEGNIFVTGFSKGLEGGIDYNTIRYRQDKSLELTTLIQGFYNENTNLMISDTATVLLRSSVSPYGIIDSATSVLNTGGNGNFYFSQAQNGIQYYLVIKHRNSVETWSASPQSFVSSSASFDFTLSANQAFGSNQIQKGSRFCIYNGEITKDGVIDASDMAIIENAASEFKKGYVISDLTGDEIVDGSDMTIADNNASNFIGVITP
ncbi:MAG: hypothetical protein HGGPFJEG_02141 [Ignavibacteria bacterium]|nr:hypothetical protein [Ignavibacteria bacterium]